jgi:DNA-binding LacI/PurR family transcriptional regulator
LVLFVENDAAGMPEKLTVIEQVAEHVRSLIVTQSLKRGDSLPSYNQLAAELGVARFTAKRGVDVLVAQGIVRTQIGQGCFVNKELSRAPRPLRHAGLIFPSSRKALFEAWSAEIMQGASSALPPDGDLHIFSMREQGLVDAAHLAEWMVDGVILLAVENDDYLRTFASWGTPGVVVDYCPRDVPLDYVACDNAAAARQVVAHLAALGHRRVAYVSTHTNGHVLDPRDLTKTLLVKNSSNQRERREESLRALQARDLFAAAYSPPALDLDLSAYAAQFATQGKADGERPTAILTDNEFAAGLLLTELGRAGIRVPDELSVCAVGGAGESSGRESLRVTRCRFDFAGMGRMAVEQLAQRCRLGKPAAPCALRVGFQFVAGETVRPV